MAASYAYAGAQPCDCQVRDFEVYDCHVRDFEVYDFQVCDAP